MKNAERNPSPLRYPGGKTKIAPLLQKVITQISPIPEVYIEPFAGGAGVGLSMLLNGLVSHIVLNDYDKAIYSFWRSVKESPNDLIELIQKTPINIQEWHKQKEIYLYQNNKYSLELGFSALFLNRTNRSGILNAGPIGGYAQNGKYKIDCRFNKELIIEKINNLSKLKKNIFIYNKEIRSFIKNILPKINKNAFIYFDPPYYKNGQRLYQNFFTHEDHSEIAHHIIHYIDKPWIITYDDTPHISAIYNQFYQKKYSINYSVAKKTKGAEIMIFKSSDLIPVDYK